MEDNKMIDSVISAKQPPPLQGRIVKVLDNPNASASELSELVAETELAIVAAEHVMASERAKAADLIRTPSAEAAQDAMSRAEAAQLNRDRLQSALPKMREMYAAALAIERRDRWASNYEKVKAEQDELRQEYNGVHQAYLSAKTERGKLIRRMEDCDLDAQRVNDAACDLDIWDRELEPLLESAAPERKWGPPKIVNGGIAVAMAQSMVSPTTYGPADWASPEYQAARRAEIEKDQARIAEFYSHQTEQQEERQNAEERERFGQRR
jgi:hypothetical protein